MMRAAELHVLSLFAGIGGLDLGLERAGMKVVGQVEIDPFCTAVLQKHWPEVPRHDDVRTAVDWWRAEPRPRVDVIAGGFPCQPVSEAGDRLGADDPRWKWPEMADVIDELRPLWVIAENVPGLRTLGLDVVLDDLARMGYRARAGLLAACEVGAPHARERLFVLAHSAGERRREGRAHTAGPRAAEGEQQDGPVPTGGSWWAVEPRMARVAYGVSRGVDRRRALGNAVVPHVAEHIGRLITGVVTAWPESSCVA